MFAFLCRVAFFQDRSVVLYAEGHARFVGVGSYGKDDALVVFFAEPARFEQGDGGTAVFAGDGSRPEVGDGGFAIYGGVETGKVGSGLLQYPPAPGANVPGEIGFDGDSLRVEFEQFGL